MQTYNHSRDTIIQHLARTAGIANSVILSAAYGRTDEALQKAALDVAAEAREMLTVIEGLPVPVNHFLPDNPYISPDVPEGYDTIFGYIERGNPGYLGDVKVPLREAYRCEERRIRSKANKAKMPLCQVVAPWALKQEGAETVTAYPVSVIRDVLY